MRIAVLMSAGVRRSVFTEKAWSRLEALGELIVNETDSADPETVRRLIAGADIAVTSWGVCRLDADILDRAPDLRLIAHAAGSVKGVVSDEVYARGIQVISSARILSEGVSEMALGLTISACKNVFASNEEIHRGGWAANRPAAMELYNLTVGVVGCGFAGSHYIELLRAFDVDILAYDPNRDAVSLEALGAEKADLDTLLCRSDIISLHAPSLDSTAHMIDARTLSLMKEDAILINTARGTLIDEAALAETMLAGKLKYACLDVTDPEPPAADNPLRSIPNVIFTPHVAGLANNGKGKIGDHVLREIARFQSAEPLLSEVTQAMLATIA